MNSKIGEKDNLRVPLILTSLSAGVMSFLLPIYSKKLNMNAVEITGLFSIISLILILIRPFIGKLVDRVGRKPILITSIITYAFSCGVFAIADTILLIYIARAIEGISTALMTVSIYAIISDTSKEDEISEGFGKINSAESTGNIYGCILAFVILSRVRFTEGWKILFIIFSIVAFYALLRVIRDFKETKNQLMIKVHKKKKLSKKTINLLIVVFITSLASSMLAPIFMIYMQDKFTNNISALAFAFFPALIIDSLLSSRIGKYSDKVGKRRAMLIGIVICGVVTILTPSVESISILAVLWCISSIGGMLYYFSITGMYAELTEESFKGEMYGVYTLVRGFGGLIGPLVGGVAYEVVSQKSPFYINGITMFIVALLVLMLIKNNTNNIDSSQKVDGI